MKKFIYDVANKFIGENNNNVNNKKISKIAPYIAPYQEGQSHTIENVPPDILKLIFSYLHVRRLCAVAQVSKGFNLQVNNPSAWKQPIKKFGLIQYEVNDEERQYERKKDSLSFFKIGLPKIRGILKTTRLVKDFQKKLTEKDKNSSFRDKELLQNWLEIVEVCIKHGFTYDIKAHLERRKFLNDLNGNPFQFHQDNGRQFLLTHIFNSLARDYRESCSLLLDVLYEENPQFNLANITLNNRANSLSTATEIALELGNTDFIKKIQVIPTTQYSLRTLVIILDKVYANSNEDNEQVLSLLLKDKKNDSKFFEDIMMVSFHHQLMAPHLMKYAFTTYGVKCAEALHDYADTISIKHYQDLTIESKAEVKLSVSVESFRLPIDYIAYIINLGYPVNERVKNMTPLHNVLKRIEKLIQKQNREDYSVAVKLSYSTIALLENGASLNIPFETGITPLEFVQELMFKYPILFRPFTHLIIKQIAKSTRELVQENLALKEEIRGLRQQSTSVETTNQETISPAEPESKSINDNMKEKEKTSSSDHFSDMESLTTVGYSYHSIFKNVFGYSANAFKFSIDENGNYKITASSNWSRDIDNFLGELKKIGCECGVTSNHRNERWIILTPDDYNFAVHRGLFSNVTKVDSCATKLIL